MTFPKLALIAFAAITGVNADHWHDVADIVNAHPTATWKAAYPQRFKDSSMKG
jgi:hypothetical protein